MIIDCDNCAVRGAACKECVISVLIGVPEQSRSFNQEECAALEALADAGLAPRLRLVPIRRDQDPGVA
ncbi:MAG TPA: hypothetical protein VFB19_15320 [Mycobacterium sp.]|nr:hypothetical protein [Mycobacterium sp.]